MFKDRTGTGYWGSGEESANVEIYTGGNLYWWTRKERYLAPLYVIFWNSPDNFTDATLNSHSYISHTSWPFPSLSYTSNHFTPSPPFSPDPTSANLSCPSPYPFYFPTLTNLLLTFPILSYTFPTSPNLPCLTQNSHPHCYISSSFPTLPHPFSTLNYPFPTLC